MSSVNPFEQNVDIYNKKISSSKTINTNQSSEVSESAQIDTSGSIYSESSDSKHYSNGLSIENDSEIDSNTYNVIKEQLENEIEQKKQALKDKKDDRGWATSLWNGAKELFGGGDKAELKEIEKLEEELKTLEAEPDNLDAVYKSIMGKDLSAEEISKIRNSSSLVSSLDSSTKQAIIDELENQYEQIEDSLETAKNSNGWISGAWDKFKNWTGIGASSNKSETQLENMKEEIEALKENPDNLAEAYKNITGKDLTTDELDKFISGETSLVSDSKAAESVSKYSEGQKMATDIVADVTSGIVAVGAIAAAPFTGGASLVLAAGVGATVKVGIKASDCIGNEKTYGLSDFAYDSVTGSINGLFAPISNGLGGAAGTGVAKAFGLEAAENTVKTALKQTAKTVGKEAAEEVLEQGAKQAGKSTISKILAKQGTEYVLKEGAESTLKTTIGKVAAYGTDMVVDGALSGATDGLARALGEGRIEDIPQDILNGLAGGAVASPLIGGGFRLATKGGSKIGNMIGKSDIGDSVADEVSDKSKSSFLNKAGELKNAASDKLHQAGDKIKNSNAYQKAGELKDAAKNKFHQMTKENKVSKDSIIPSPDETQIDGQLAFADAAPSSGSIKNVDETIAQTGDNAQIPGQMTLDDWQKQREFSTIPSPDETQIDGQLAFADAAPSSGSIKNVDETIAQTGDNAQIPGQMTLDDWQKQREFSTIPSPDETQIDGQLAFADAAPSSGSIKNVDETITQTGDNAQIPGQMTLDDWQKQREFSTIPSPDETQIDGQLAFADAAPSSGSIKNVDETIAQTGDNAQIPGQMTLDDWQKQREFSTIPSPDETQIDGQLAFANAAPSSGSIKNVDETIAQTGDNAQIPGQMTLDDLVNKPESDITEKRSLLSKITTLKNKIKTKITDKQIQKIKTHLNTDQDYIKAAQKLGIDTSYWKKFRGGELNDLLKNDIIAIKLGKNAEKTFVPKFSSADDAISKLKVGDICQIADTGKISIKTADGSLKTLKLSPQKYLELFPPISRYAMEQKYIGDCYLIASLDIMNKTPETRANLLECFTENADGSVTVKIPKGKISQTFAADKTAEDYVSNNFFSIRISEQRSGKKSDFIINGPEGMKMLEYTYGLNLLDDEIDKLQSELYDSSRCINNQQKNVDYYSDILSTFGDKSVDVDLLRKKIEKYNIDGFYQHFTEQTENGIKLNLKRIKEVSLRMDGDKKECLTAILEMGDNPDFDFIEKKWLQFNSQSIDETIEKMILPDGTINADYINGSIQNAESIINELGESTDKIQKQILDLTQKNPSETAEALRDKGGMMYKVFEKFGIEADRTYYQPEKVKELLHDPENFDKYIFGGGTRGNDHSTYLNEKLGISQHHAHSIKPFISESGEYLYRVTNPWNTAQSSVLTYDQIKEYFDSIYFARIKN